MKFAKALEEDLVPEWRVKYLDYKQGKKKVKAVARALRNANRTPKLGGRQSDRGTPTFDKLPFTHYDFQNRGKRTNSDSQTPLVPARSNPSVKEARPWAAARGESTTMFAKSPVAFIPDSKPATPDAQPLKIPDRNPTDKFRTRYGSIIGTPPDHDPPPNLPRLELPDPAMDPDKGKGLPTPSAPAETEITESVYTAKRPSLGKHSASDAYHVGAQHSPHRSLHKTLFRSHRSQSYHSPKQANTYPKSKLRRLFATAGESPGTTDVQLDAYRELDARQDEFFEFLDKEYNKIEAFYSMKEREASHRLEALRNQLHELRDRRIEEINEAKRRDAHKEPGLLQDILPETSPRIHGNGHGPGFLKPIEDAVRRQTHPHIGKTSKAMKKLASPDGPQGSSIPDDQKDYTRRASKTNEKVPYRFAKRRLKLALQEFYRGLELLKSYALLNRTGFRKINKKYDKAVNARPTGRYVTEKVNQAHFVQSSIIEGHLVAVEDLYARYFERGNHKIAVNKLRSKLKPSDQSAPAFRNGLFIAAGLAFGVEGLVRGISAQHLFAADPVVNMQASYLLQIYAAYFLSVLLFLFFVLDCYIWAAARINYVFIFEYDTRHVLDWRQLAELPCLFFFMNSLFLWLNFRQGQPDRMYIYWPVLLCSLTLIILALPLPILYHRARKWWGYSNWRLLLAGLYPVEFRDFYLGDMYCSETYAMSQVEVFFCLYAQHWRDPPRCNSSHSRLLGFFTTLPAIWRAFQCLRRYYDSRNWFPHLANFAKYMCNVLYYMTLSMYRIHLTGQMRAIFITFAAINAIYCSFWDVAMDFSLGNPWAEQPFLRDRLAYRHVWVYYVAMILDVLLRQQWVFYALFQHDLQHAAAMSFLIGLAEVFRRGMWSLFRVENEHCNNVGKFRASRDIPLPYTLPGKQKDDEEGSRTDDDCQGPPLEHYPSTGADTEHGKPSPGTTASNLRNRKLKPVPSTPGIRALQRVGTVIASAHAQDFEKKKRPEVVGTSPTSTGMHKRFDSSDEDDDDDHSPQHTSEDDEDGEDVMTAQRLVSRGKG